MQHAPLTSHLLYCGKRVPITRSRQFEKQQQHAHNLQGCSTQSHLGWKPHHDCVYTRRKSPDRHIRAQHAPYTGQGVTPARKRRSYAGQAGQAFVNFVSSKSGQQASILSNADKKRLALQADGICVCAKLSVRCRLGCRRYAQVPVKGSCFTTSLHPKTPCDSCNPAFAQPKA